MGEGVASLDAFALVEQLGYLEGGALAHAIVEEVGGGVGQDAGEELIVPIVVVRQPTHRGFDTGNNDRGIGIELLENARVDIGGTVGAKTCLAARSVGIVVTQTTGGGIVVYHTVHHSAVDSKEKSWLPEFAEVAQVVAPVGLRDDSHTVACCFECAPNDGCTEGRMVDVCIARDQNYVDLFPPETLDLI